MKKGVLFAVFLLLFALCSLCSLYGCSVANHIDTFSSGSPAESSVSIAADHPDYLSWNAETWKSATDEEKSACALAYYNYLMQVFGNSQPSNGSVPEERVGDVMRSLNTVFQSMEGTSFSSLKAIVDASYNAASGSISNVQS